MRFGELTHFSHPHHKLRFEYSEFPFKCDGCKEVGIGSRFKCSLCDYDLHKHCALPPPSSTIRHPFYPKCTFQFLSRPPGTSPRYCNACERDVYGFIYHCFTCGFDLHPCCANLPHLLDAEGGVRLFLYRKVIYLFSPYFFCSVEVKVLLTSHTSAMPMATIMHRFWFHKLSVVKSTNGTLSCIIISLS